MLYFFFVFLFFAASHKYFVLNLFGKQKIWYDMVPQPKKLTYERANKYILQIIETEWE